MMTVNTVSEYASLFVCIANDFHHIHIHSRGLPFDTIHEIARKYYEKASDQVDDLKELAMMCDEPVINACDAVNHIKGYKWVSQTSFDWDESVTQFDKLIDYIIQGAKIILKNYKDNLAVQSYINDLTFIYYWEKEKKFLNKGRLKY